MKASVNMILNGVIVGIVVVAIIFMITPYRMFIVLSDSMKPVLSKGSIAVGKQLDMDDVIMVNDIYTYIDSDGYSITHRAIGKTEDGYIFKGDNNTLPDVQIISRKQIKYHILK